MRQSARCLLDSYNNSMASLRTAPQHALPRRRRVHSTMYHPSPCTWPAYAVTPHTRTAPLNSSTRAPPPAAGWTHPAPSLYVLPSRRAPVCFISAEPVPFIHPTGLYPLRPPALITPPAPLTKTQDPYVGCVSGGVMLPLVMYDSNADSTPDLCAMVARRLGMIFLQCRAYESSMVRMP